MEENFEDNGHKSYAHAPCITQKTKNTHRVCRMWNYNQLAVNPYKTTYKICHINPPYNYISNIYCTSHVTYMSHVCAIRSQSISHKCNTSYIYACSLVFLVWALWHGLDDPTYVRSLGVAIWSYLHPSISTALMRPRRPKQYCLQLVIYIYIHIYIYT